MSNRTPEKPDATDETDGPQRAVHQHPDESSDWDGSVEKITDVREIAGEPLDDSIDADAEPPK